MFVLAFLNSSVSEYILQILSPTLGFESGYVSSIPYSCIIDKNAEIPSIVSSNISLSQSDWDSYETSWDFKRNPLV